MTHIVTQRSPISLLELNTFGHAVCALLIYLCWWKKPLDISDTTFFEQSQLVKRRALELMKLPSKAATCAICSIKARIKADSRYHNLEKVLSSLLLSALLSTIMVPSLNSWAPYS